MTVEDWARSGLGYLTGLPDGEPDLSRAPVLAHAEAVLSDFRSLAVDLGAGERFSSGPGAATYLTGRAALTGRGRAGRVSVGGATRLMEASDTTFALSLARDDDLALVPALLESADIGDDPWAAISRAAPYNCARDWVARARMLGLPASVLGERDPTDPQLTPRGAAVPRRPIGDLLVVDLSALWAGPLCTHLLQQAGATVVKVESRTRPDGARRGHRGFFDWLNSGKLSYCVDFDGERENLTSLLSMADVVIEASRPRALAQRGLSADQVPVRPGAVWLRLTAHGATGEAAAWTGFGDDAAAAGGLVAETTTGPVFCGDAIADPLTGLEAARRVAAALAAGGGVRIDMALSQVAAGYAALGTVATPRIAPRSLPPQPPPAAEMAVPAADLGADNAAVDALVAQRA